VTVSSPLDEDAVAYVLGTMDGAERASFEAALLDDAELAALVWRAEEGLRPLADAVPSRRPRRRVLAQAERRIFGEERTAARASRGAARFWRALASLLALAATGIAAAALVLAFRPEALLPPAAERVAAIAREGGPAVPARLRPDGTLVVAAFAAPDAPGTPFLWLAEADGPPRPLARLDPAAPTAIPLGRDIASRVLDGARLLVTAEAGGDAPPATPSPRRLGEGVLTPL